MQPQHPRDGGGARFRRSASPAPTLPGYTLCRALHSVGGPPWRARDTATGTDVVLRPLPPGVVAAGYEGLPEHPHLSVPRVVPGAGGAGSFVVNGYADHGGLDALLARRTVLAPAEVSTVVLAVGRALAAMHADGRVHGAVSASTVLLDGSQRPLLDGARCVRMPRSGDRANDPMTSADDVSALGRLATELLAGEVPDGLRATLSAATDPDASLRPTAAALVRAVVGAVAPEPLRPSPETGALPTRGDRPGGLRDRLRSVPDLRRRRTTQDAPTRQVTSRRARPGAPRGHVGERAPRRWRAVVVPVVVAVALLSAAVVVGVSWGRVSDDQDVTPQALDRSMVTPAAAATASPAVDPAPDWPTILDDLDTARAAAFANADTVVLGVVDAPGSPALTADRAAVRALAARNLQARGFRIEVVAVRVTTVDTASVVLDVTDRRQPYELVGADGSVVASQPGRGRARWRVELVLAGDAWLVRDVRAIT